MIKSLVSKALIGTIRKKINPPKFCYFFINFKWSLRPCLAELRLRSTVREEPQRLHIHLIWQERKNGSGEYCCYSPRCRSRGCNKPSQTRTKSCPSVSIPLSSSKLPSITESSCKANWPSNDWWTEKVRVWPSLYRKVLIW